VTPAQIELAIKLGLVAIVLAAAAAGGWKLNGWRLGPELEQTRRARDVAIAQGKALVVATEACTAGVARTEKLADEAIAQGRALLAEAQRLKAGSDGQVARLEELLKQKPRPGDDCNSAWDKIEKLGQP